MAFASPLTTPREANVIGKMAKKEKITKGIEIISDSNSNNSELILRSGVCFYKVLAYSQQLQD